MSKTRDKAGATAQSVATNRGHEWMTQLAFITALVLVLTRATIADFSSARGEPLGSDVPRAPGAATVLLVRSWLRLRLVAAIAFGLLLAYLTHSLFFRFIELPDLKARWEKDKGKILAERGLSDDPFLAKQFENRVLAGELMGFFNSPNTMGAMVVMLMVISTGLAVQRMMDDKSDRAGVA